MYKIQKTGKLFQVVSPNGLVQFSSLQRANCSRWVQAVQETQEEKEQKYLCEDAQAA
jgi:hypothetical protein